MEVPNVNRQTLISLADKTTDAVAIVIIGWMALNGVQSIEAISAIGTIAIGTSYIRHRQEKRIFEDGDKDSYRTSRR